MKKADMTIGQSYRIKYGSDPMILLAKGGYAPRATWALSEAERESRITAKPGLPGGVSDNLMLRVPIAVPLDSISYTEADYLAGKPLPERTYLVSVPSAHIENPWHIYLIHAERMKQVVADRAAADKLRKEVTIPQVHAELERLGLKNLVTEFDKKIEFTLDAFLALAARIPTEDTK